MLLGLHPRVTRANERESLVARFLTLQGNSMEKKLLRARAQHRNMRNFGDGRSVLRDGESKIAKSAKFLSRYESSRVAGLSRDARWDMIKDKTLARVHPDVQRAY